MGYCASQALSTRSNRSDKACSRSLTPWLWCPLQGGPEICGGSVEHLGTGRSHFCSQWGFDLAPSVAPQGQLGARAGIGRGSGAWPPGLSQQPRCG